MRRAEGDRRLEILRHAHGQRGQAALARDLGKQGEMRPGIFVRRRQAHEAGDGKAVPLATGRDEARGVGRRNARFLRLLAGVDLDEHFRSPPLPCHLARQFGRDLVAVDCLDTVKQRHRLRRLVALQRADQVQFDARMAGADRRPFCPGFLYAVFAEDHLAGRDRRFDFRRAEGLGYRNEADGARDAPARPFGGRDPGADIGKTVVNGAHGAIPIAAAMRRRLLTRWPNSG
jgi:hypothetical protein